ncbi:complement C1q tumor necrosis factor-related protein 4-like [Antedon mediterranea]|uniref:complement C1q tumor necrosis factor-related protein 4-like n=1 Tax=Antedon mediterranea TaxID=105859 RepID=UPI003AF94FAA
MQRVLPVCILLALYLPTSFALSKYFQDSAFSAKFTGTINKTISETIEDFQTPVLNRGEDFNSATGTFTCELPGTYYFEIDVHLADDQTNTKLSTDLVFISNVDNLVLTSNLKILNSETASVVALGVGDRVQLHVPYGLVETFDDDHPLVLTGFLLNHDCHCGGKFTKEVSFTVVNLIQPGESIELGNVTYQLALNNIGNCINADTGIFTAPYSGTYYFSFTAITKGMVTFEINKNNEAVLTMTDGADFDSLSGSTVLALVKGDTVLLEYSAGSPIELVGGSIVFTGFLL